MTNLINTDKIKSFLKAFLGETSIHFVQDFIFRLKLYGFFRKVHPSSTNHELIRVGGDEDGGYLIPNDLTGISYCFSPGVSNVSDFELDLASNWQIKCFLADYSVDKPPVSHHLFEFEKKFLASTQSPIHLTLDDWVMQKAKNHGDLLLQMDIEGDEYKVLLTASEETLRKFRIIVVEFHGMRRLFYPHQEEHRFKKINNCFMKLLKYFEIVHIHPNNCGELIGFKEFSTPDLLEVTFLRKDRITCKSKRKDFPHKLDKSSISSKPDLHLPKCWYM